VPVSEFESPKLKTAGKSKWMDLAQGNKNMVVIMQIIHLTLAMAI